MFTSVLMVILGSIAGGLGRWLIQQYFTGSVSNDFPWATWIVNITGSFLIGFIFVLLDKCKYNQSAWQLLLMTGFCGGFTTFSAFSLENIRMLQLGNYWQAFMYIISSVILGLFAVWLGLKTGKLI